MADVYEIAHKIAYQPKDRLDLFRELPLPIRSAVFARSSMRIQQSLLLGIPRKEAIELLDHLDPRRVSRTLACLPNARTRRYFILHLKRAQREKTEHFLSFHPKATITLIHFNYVLLSEDDTVGDAASAIEEYWKDTGRFPEVLLHCNGALSGEVPLATLVRESNKNRLSAYRLKVKTIPYQASKRDIIDTFVDTPHRKAVVLDTDGSVIGLVYSDDVLDLLGNGDNSSLYTFAGVEESERPFDSVGSKVRRRWKWLVINLATAFLAAGVVSYFRDIIATLVLLAVYLPVVSGMGGNAATQTLVVMARGIAIGEIDLKNSLPALWREIGAGAINGIINGVLVMLIAVFWNHNPLFGLVVALAMVVNLMIAGLFGTIIPLILRAMGKDPATAATIFITTATDVFGFLAFLGLASLILF